MTAEIFVKRTLDELSEEIRTGDPSRALAQLNILLQQFEPLGDHCAETIARILLCIGRALEALGSKEEAYRVTLRAEALLQKASIELDVGQIELFIVLASDLAKRGCKKEALHFSRSVLFSIASNLDCFRDERLAELLSAYAKVMELCAESKCAHVARTLALLCLHSVSGFESQVAWDLVDSDFYKYPNEYHFALKRIQQTVSERMRLSESICV